jgi:UDP-glucose 4-epimerase
MTSFANEPLPMGTKKILVTGAAGFLGSHLADALLSDGHTVIGVDNLIGGEKENVSPACQFVIGDCNDFSLMKTLLRDVDVVYHCAATAYEGFSVFSPHIVTQNVVTASTGVISAAAACGVARFVFCSSMARYGENTVPFTEDMTPRPQDPYGIGKYAVELILQNLSEVHGMEWVIAVPHNIIGPRQKYDDPYRNVAAIFINLMLQSRQPIIYGDGGQMRCFSFVDDAVGPLKQMGFDPGVAQEIINIGPDREFVSVLALARIIADLLHFDLDVQWAPSRPQEVYLANCSAE